MKKLTVLHTISPAAHTCCWILAAFMLGAGGSFPLHAEETEGLHGNYKTILATYDTLLQEHAGRTNVYLEPGIIADRDQRSVTLWAESTGLSVYDPIEFILIGPKSGHAYEAFARSFADPGELDKALQFIGMPPGRPVNPAAMHFWPRGERVIAHVSWTDPADPHLSKTVRAEQLIVDSRTEQTLPLEGFAFTGSGWGSKGQAGPVYIADEYEPMSMMSDYNETTTVLDVPYIASDHETYGHLTLNPEMQLPEDLLLTFTFRPEYPEGTFRVMDVFCRLDPGTGWFSSGYPELTLIATNGTPLNDKTSLRALKKTLEELAAEGKDVFAELRWDPSLKLKHLQRAVVDLRELEEEELIRIKAPADDHLYHLAFTPDEQWRDRTQRPSQPAELYISRSFDSVAGMLTVIDETWIEGKADPELNSTAYPLASPADLSAKLKSQEYDHPVILIFAEPDITSGDLLEYIRPIRKSVSVFYIFLPEKGA